MPSLPPYHVARPRLTDRCLGERVVVVEAGAGYGKTTLGAELAEAWRSIGIEVTLLEARSGAGLLAARLQAATRRAGYAEAAGAMAAAGDDPQAAVEDLLQALTGERCTFVLDDVHNADRSAAGLIEHLAARVSGEQRAVVLSRHLPVNAGRLRRGEYAQLTAADLALRSEEAEAICREGFGLEVDDADIAALDDATGGWTAAAVLAASRSQRTGERIRRVARSSRPGPRGASDAVAAILDDALAILDETEVRRLAQLARLPLIDRGLVEAVTGPGSAERYLSCGIPLSVGTGWWEMPGPVRDLLQSLAPADPETLRAAAEVYAGRGEVAAALQLLAVHGLDLDAARLLAATEYRHLEAVDVVELRAVVDVLSNDAVEAHPQALVNVILACSSATLLRSRTSYLERAARLSERLGDPAFSRAVRLEQAKDAVAQSRFEEAETSARAILAEAPATEALTRAGAFGTLGRAVCWRTTPEGARDLGALEEADRHLSTSAAMYLDLGMPGAAAIVAQYQAYWIDYAKGNAAAGLARLEAGLARVADRPRIWGSLMSLRFEMELELGRFADAEVTLAETSRVADLIGDVYTQNYVEWNRAILESYRGRADESLAALRRCEASAGDWWLGAGADFLVCAAECMARVGEATLAFEYLDRAQADVMDAEHLVALTEAVLTARFGDPAAAEERLLGLTRHRLDPRETWRVVLFRALAAFRRDDPAAGALAARAFEEAAAIGLDEVPLIRERDVTVQLLGLALQTGLPAPKALEAVVMPVEVRVLGGFAVRRGGRDVELSPGQGVQLVKLLALSAGRMPADQVIDVLWPEATSAVGRNRLRTVLNRLRAEAGELVEREGEVLVLAKEVTVDLARFESEARRALALGVAEPLMSSALARAAIARYRGDLLPEDLYVPWAEARREAARRLMLRLLDLCADTATARGDLDEVRRVVEMTIDLAPYDDERYLRAASTLLGQGRRGAALAVVRRARASLAELGLAPSPALQELEEQIVA